MNVFVLNQQGKLTLAVKKRRQLPAPEGAGLSREIRDTSSDTIGD